MDTLENVICQYIERGFGSMNKNDFEVWIFHWLLENHQECKGKSDFAICESLKIPETKVKRLRYEAELKYGNMKEDNFREQLFKYLKKAKYRGSEIEGRIVFAIPNQLVRQKLYDILQKDGRFCDSSFNSNIVHLASEDFFFLLKEILLTKDEVKEIEKSKEFKEIKNLVAKEVHDGKKMPITTIENFKELGIGVGKIIIEQIAGSSVNSFLPIIKSSISSIIKILK